MLSIALSDNKLKRTFDKSSLANLVLSTKSAKISLNPIINCVYHFHFRINIAIRENSNFLNLFFHKLMESNNQYSIEKILPSQRS